eukprot:jgi/Bigna1/86168/estExt_fgenesh1_pg.C_80235
MFLETMQQENKELSESLDKFKSKMGMLKATEDELERVEHAIEGMVSTSKRLNALEESLNKTNAAYILRLKQDELDQKKFRALYEVMEAFEDVDTKDHDGSLTGREIENMKRLLKRLPSFFEIYEDTETKEKKKRLVFEVDWEKIDTNKDGELSKWEFRRAMDVMLSEHYTIFNAVYLEEAKEAVKDYNLGKWWEESEFLVRHSSVGHWFEDPSQAITAAAKVAEKRKSEGKIHT